MPEINFGVQSSQARSKRSSAGGCVNFIREIDGEDLILYRRPGYVTKTTVGSKAGRGAIEANGVAYIVVGGEIYSMDSDYNDTFIGNLQTTAGRVSMSWDGTFIVVVDGSYLYTYSIVSGTWARHTDGAIGSNPTHVVFSDGYHFINDPITGQVQTHEVAYRPDGEWNALDYATAEFNPDQLKALVASKANVFLIGETTTEPWEYDPNALALPLRPIRAAYTEFGTVAPFSAVNFDNTVVWLARDKNGKGVMVRSTGGSVERISTNIEEAQWANYSDMTDAYSVVWWIEGHSILLLTFPSADKTWAFDSSLPQGLQWSEWQRGNDNPQLRGRMRFQWSIHLNGKTVCGDYENSNIYEVDWDVHTDAGEVLHWSCRTMEIKTKDEEETAHRQLKVYSEGGVGLTDADDVLGIVPKMFMRYTDDHGENWVEQTAREFGKKGEYNKRVFWNQLGSSRHRIYELYGYSPVVTTIAGGNLA